MTLEEEKTKEIIIPIAECEMKTVKLYTQNAEITRKMKVKLEKGEQSVVMSGIPVLLNDIIKAKGPSEAVILEISKREREIEIENDQTTTIALKEEIKKLEEEIKQEDKKLKRIESEESYVQQYIESIFDSGRENKNVEEMISKETLEGITSSLEFYQKKMKTVDEKKFKIKNEILPELQERLLKLKHDLSLEKPEKTIKIISEIVILLDCEKEIEVNLEITYMVGNSKWISLYGFEKYLLNSLDLRVTSNETAKLLYYGEITQNTKEDWKNVNLSLSTTNPSFNSQPPELSGVTIRFKQKQQYYVQKKSKGFSLSVGGGNGGGGTREYYKEEGDMKNQLTKSEKGSISSTYHIPNFTTIPSDNISHRIFIGEIDLKPIFSFYSVPRLSEKVYAKMKTLNESDYQLLTGRMSIFYNNDFVSKSNLTSVAPGESFEAYLGVDTEIKLEYINPRKFKETKGFFSTEIKMNVERKIKISNKKQKEIDIVVIDQLPLSGHSEIKVDLIEPNSKLIQEKELNSIINFDKNTIEKIVLNHENNIEWQFKLVKDIQLQLKYSVTWKNGENINSDY
eukprot:gene2473-3182_t